MRKVFGKTVIWVYGFWNINIFIVTYSYFILMGRNDNFIYGIVIFSIFVGYFIIVEFGLLLISFLKYSGYKIILVPVITFLLCD